MGILDPYKVTNTETHTSVSILRPHVANPDNLALQTAIKAGDKPDLFESVTDDFGIWEIRGALIQVSELRTIIEFSAERARIPVSLNEYQVRRSENRDCYTHDLQRPERAGALSAKIITIQDPNLGQIHFLKEFMRHALCQRVIILFSDRSRINDYISDLGLDYTPIDNNGSFIADNKRRKLHLVNHHDEDQIKKAVTMSLQEVA